MALLLITIGFRSIHYKRINDFNWRIGGSNPKKFMVNQAQVDFFYNNEWISGALLGPGGNNGWQEINGMIMGSDYLLSVPDSITTKWFCDTDKILYEGSYKLPREKMLELFRTKAIDFYGDQNDYNLIVVGMAPGGNVTVWMRGGSASTEICRFKANNKGVWKEDDPDYDKYTKEHLSLSEGFKESSTYWKIHGIPYSVWEKGEKEYDYDIGFTTEEEDKKDYSIAIAGYTKDGSIIYSNENPIPYIKWNEKVKLKVTKGKKLPVQFWMRWHSRDGNEWYESQIVLPINLDKQLLKFQEQYGKDVFLAVGMDKVSKNKPYTFGKIWLENSKEKIEIMKFRASKFNLEKNDFEISQYSLPKDFVFPKWQGREPIEFPELDYWQEK
ncbi:DUF2931 family protein [Flavobacterium sp. CFBP9031]|uniref:DUF2931 family protein n=1 Tax=Flavobacterium sp. CFBP9031 TaxID=3096538 RepID=UPI002A6A8FB3|nr:DUF2931 family protein [Flavobacterium sp. CFBP9031]MDY0989650.1 DUF2931 family protein [Flavobacterium sp. CFBP9031]